MRAEVTRATGIPAKIPRAVRPSIFRHSVSLLGISTRSVSSDGELGVKKSLLPLEWTPILIEQIGTI